MGTRDARRLIAFAWILLAFPILPLRAEEAQPPQAEIEALITRLGADTQLAREEAQAKSLSG